MRDGPLLRIATGTPRCSDDETRPAFAEADDLPGRRSGGSPGRKALAGRIAAQIASSNDLAIGHDSSTNALIRRYRRLRY